MQTYELRQMQSLPLDAKIAKSQQRIKEWYDHWDGNVYISVSGKDSAVVCTLVRDMYPHVPVVFCDTGLEWQEIKDYIKRIPNTITIRPKMTFKQVIDKYGYPVVSKEQANMIWQYRHATKEETKTRLLEGKGDRHNFSIRKKWRFLIDAPFQISAKCCDYLKKQPFNEYATKTNSHPFMGVMADESNQRTGQYLRHGCNALGLKRPRSHPIGFWTEQDVLSYIDHYKIDYPSIYGDVVTQPNGLLRFSGGLQQTGCMFCLFGATYIMGESKFQVMKRLHPKIYTYCMEDLGIKDIIIYINQHLHYRERILYE